MGDWPAVLADADRLIALSGGGEADFYLLSAHALARAGRMKEAFTRAGSALTLRPTPTTVQKIQRALRLGAFVSTAQRDPAAFSIGLLSSNGGLADGSPEAVEWWYEKSPPRERWLEIEGFDDFDWQVGVGPFSDRAPGWKPIGTPWPLAEPTIWLRHSFEVVEGDDLDIPLRVIGRTFGPAPVFLNGERLAELTALGVNSYSTPEIAPSARLRRGTNVLAVEAHVLFGNFIDVGLPEHQRRGDGGDARRGALAGER